MRRTEQISRYDYLGQEIVVVNKILMRFIFYLLFFSPATRVIVCGWSVRETGNQFGVALSAPRDQPGCACAITVVN